MQTTLHFDPQDVSQQCCHPHFVEDSACRSQIPKVTGDWGKPSLKLTGIAHENRLGPKRKQSYSNSSFSRGELLVSGRVHEITREQFLAFGRAGLMSTPRRKLFICLAVLRYQIPDQLSCQFPMTYEAEIFGTKQNMTFGG